eukprot:TRINITY_DN5052_c0_g2_i2.p1 TRINITY_DN5052_c0_g2~~TRINITY_DN5052_c0_g2_i2.p1  ORF type:complete len:393 (-),score=80.94 TRINITY_DN5052_c0_g2_i2:420-1598(-)
MTVAPSVVILVLGHVLFGVGVGLAMHGASVYIAEVAPCKIRGILVSLSEVFIVLGILVGYVLATFFIGIEHGWRYMFGASLPPAALMAIGMFFLLPPSPRWLLLRANQSEDPKERSACVEAAKESVQQVRGPTANEENINREVDWLMKAQEEGEEKGREDGLASFTELFKGSSFQALIVGAGLVLFQQLTGQPTITYYADSILQDAGFAEASDAAYAAVLLGGFKLVITGVAVLFVDKVGRRPLLLIGVGGIVLSLFSLGVFYAMSGANPFLGVAALLVYVGAYQVSFGPVTWIMVAEVFPLAVRGRAQSVVTVVNFAVHAVVTFTLPCVQDVLGEAGIFFTFGMSGLLALAFIFFRVPETKGLTLEQIETGLMGARARESAAARQEQQSAC